MATNHTTNYALNLWEPQDSFLRTEFNENSQKIDAAIKAVDAKVSTKADTSAVNTALAKKADAATQLHIAWGSYTGNGNWETTINLGVPAKLLYIYRHGTYSHWGFLYRGDNVAYDGGQKMFVVWGENSVTFKPHPGSTYPDDLVMFNDEGRTYRWIALY